MFWKFYSTYWHVVVRNLFITMSKFACFSKIFQKVWFSNKKYAQYKNQIQYSDKRTIENHIFFRFGIIFDRILLTKCRFISKWDVIWQQLIRVSISSSRCFWPHTTLTTYLSTATPLKNFTGPWQGQFSNAVTLLLVSSIYSLISVLGTKVLLSFQRSNRIFLRNHIAFKI